MNSEVSNEVLMKLKKLDNDKVRLGAITDLADIPEGLKVKVYRNICGYYARRNMTVYSVADAETGKVLYHVEQIQLQSVVFKVSQAGRQRVLREKQKNVHAFVCGATSKGSRPNNDTYLEVTYNPYKHTHFVLRDESGMMVLSAHNAFLGQLGVRVWYN